MPSTTTPTSLRAARKARRVSQARLASTLGMDRTALSRIETGERCPTPAQAEAIEVHFGVPAGHFRWPQTDPILETAIRRIVAAMPPLTDAQRAALTGHLAPAADSEVA